MMGTQILKLFLVIMTFFNTKAEKCKCGKISTAIELDSKSQSGSSNSRIWRGTNITEVGRYPWQILLSFSFGDTSSDAKKKLTKINFSMKCQN